MWRGVGEAQRAKDYEINQTKITNKNRVSANSPLMISSHTTKIIQFIMFPFTHDTVSLLYYTN